MAVLSLLGLGFLLGVKHAFDADHVAAVSAMAINQSIKKSSLLGMFWGFGHAISLLIAGFAVLLLKITITQKLALSFELIVGIMLVILGVNVLVTLNKNRMHIHKHGNEAHIHFHSHKLIKHHQHTHLPIKRSLFIGMVHGLAGSAALTLIVLAAVSSVFIGLIYILLFGIGSITGMMLISSIISLPFKLVPNKLQKVHKSLQLSAGLISIIIGLTILA